MPRHHIIILFYYFEGSQVSFLPFGRGLGGDAYIGIYMVRGGKSVKLMSFTGSEMNRQTNASTI